MEKKGLKVSLLESTERIDYGLIERYFNNYKNYYELTMGCSEKKQNPWSKVNEV